MAEIQDDSPHADDLRKSLKHEEARKIDVENE